MKTLGNTHETKKYVHNKLMSSSYQTKTVFAIEFIANVSTKSVSCSSGRNAPAGLITRIRPQQIAHAALVTDVNDSIQFTNLVQCEYGWRQTTVKSENLSLN